MSAHFITGTGTDIGKTWLTCALLRHWRAPRAAGWRPASRCSPASTPCTRWPATRASCWRRWAAKSSPAELDAIAPWRFAAPLSPDMAAAREGRRVDFDELVGFTRRFASAVPADTAAHDFSRCWSKVSAASWRRSTTSHTVRDWIAASGLPCVLVTGSYLGSLSHTLTALAALEKVGAGVTAIVVNESPDSSVGLDATLESLARHVGGIPLVAIARDRPGEGVGQLAGLAIN